MSTRKSSKTDLALPDAFRQTALAFPNKVKAMIAKIQDVDMAVDSLAKAKAVVSYSKQIKATYEEVNHIQYGKLLLVAKVGELCPKEKGGRGKTRTPDVQVFHRNTLADYRKLAKQQREGRIDDYWEAILEIGHENAEATIKGFLDFIGAGGVIATRHGGGVVAWYTPKEYLIRVRKVLETIELDPASSKFAQRTVKAKTYYTKDDDGLAHDWEGKVFLNPPFKMPLVAQFVNKLSDEYEAERVTEAILLTNNNTDTDWWQRTAKTASALCLTDGRINFYNEAGETSAPTNGQSFAYFGDNVDRFIQVFSDVGICLGTFNGDS